MANIILRYRVNGYNNKFSIPMDIGILDIDHYTSNTAKLKEYFPEVWRHGITDIITYDHSDSVTVSGSILIRVVVFLDDDAATIFKLLHV
jgi:hypothetical protein